LKFPDTEPLSPPILQLNDVTFEYTKNRVIFSNVNLGATMDSRICIVSFQEILLMNCQTGKIRENAIERLTKAQTRF
jgi:ATPase subunit of ABC transporter with duplicated ATPase domains